MINLPGLGVSDHHDRIPGVEAIMSFRVASLLLLISFVLAVPAVGQPLPHLWSKRFGDADRQAANDVAVDLSDNVLLCGSFKGIIDLGTGPLISGGDTDVFVAKLDPSGNGLWSKRTGDAQAQAARAIVADAEGNVVVAGQFSGAVDFGGGIMTSAGLLDIFVVKFGPDGLFVWGRRFGDATDQTCSCVAVDRAGSVTLAGSFTGSVNFGGGLLTSAGSTDIYLVTFDPFGNVLRSHRFGDAAAQEATGLAVDSEGSIVLTGSMQGSLNLGGGVLLSTGGDDLFLARFAADGTHVWSRRAGDDADQSGADVAFAPSGNVALAGTFAGAIDLGGGTLVSAGAEDICVAEFDPSGAVLWSRRFGDRASQIADQIAVNHLNQVVVTGGAQGTVNFGGGALVSAGGYDVFLAAYDDAGQPLSSQLNGNSADQTATSLCIDGDDRFLLAGSFAGNLDLGGGPLTGAGDTDAFLAKLDCQAATDAAAEATPGSQVRVHQNPLDPRTTIEFGVVQTGRAEARIYDTRGQLVRLLFDDVLAPGWYVRQWDGRDTEGRQVGRGAYLLELRRDGRTVTEQLMIAR
jgi:hypothetical protein